MCSSPDILVVEFVSFSLFALKKKKTFKKGSHRCHPYGREELPVSQHDAIALNPAEAETCAETCAPDAHFVRLCVVKTNGRKKNKKKSRGPNEDTGIENAY